MLFRSLQEATAFTLQANKDAAPRPKQAEQVYQWMVEETPDLSAEDQRARDALIYRQGLEHAIVMGDSKTIRRHACPGCGTWGLFWRGDIEAAVCVNRYCADDDGIARRWSLAEIADDHLGRRDSSRRRAT